MSPTHECPEADTAAETAKAQKKRRGGPSSESARESSKRNALKHGLMAEKIFPDDLKKAIDAYTAELIRLRCPRDDNELWLVGQVAKCRAKLDKIDVLSLVDQQRVIDRVPLMWDRDRMIHVQDLGARLATDPRRVREKLAATKQGAQWIRQTWDWLGDVAENLGEWTEDQRDCAFELLGMPERFRVGSRRVPAATDTAGLKALVAAQMSALTEEIDGPLGALDDAAKALAGSGVSFEEDAETRRLRRYAAIISRALASAERAFEKAREARPEEAAAAAAAEPAPEARPYASAAAGDFLAERYDRNILSAPHMVDTILKSGDEAEAEVEVEGQVEVEVEGQVEVEVEVESEAVSEVEEVPAEILEFLREDRRRRDEGFAPASAPVGDRPFADASMSVPAPAPTGNRRHRKAAAKRQRLAEKRKGQ